MSDVSKQLQDQLTKARATPGRRAVVGLALMAVLLLGAAKAAGPALYPWMKAVHVVAVISWMAGLLYLPRLFVYHCAAEKGSTQSETFKQMEQRLLNVICGPAMIASWVIGLWLAWTGKWLSSPWFLVKLLLVIALSGAHGYFAASVRKFAEDRNDKDARHWRIVNEVPTGLMILIVILVVVKPW